MTKIEEQIYEKFDGMTIEERVNYVADCMTADELEALSLAILEKSVELRKHQRRMEKMGGGFDYMN